MRKPWLCAALVLAGCLDPDDPGNLVPRTVAEDPDLPHIEIAGTLLHAEAFGDPSAPIVMVLHGGPGGDYRDLLPLRALSDDGFRVVFWDQRGAGLSQRHDAGSYTLTGYLDDLRLVIEHYTVTPGQPLVFIGHSWGAMYLTWFINEHGDYGGRIRGAVLSEPGAFTNMQLEAFMNRLLASIELTSEQLNDGTWSRQFMSAGDHARADYLAALLQSGGAPSEANDPGKPTPSWRIGAVVSQALPELGMKHGFDWTTNLPAYTRKVLFLRGDLNTAATEAHQRELASAYPNADVVTMTDVGHAMQWERPDEYLAHTRAYFQHIGFSGVTP
jgi:proline iminopeptidase